MIIFTRLKTTVMKLFPALIVSVLLLSSCQEGWTDEYKESFKQTCLTGSAPSDLTDEQKQKYCDCALEKTMQHYHNITEVVENKDSTQMSAALKECYSDLVK